MTETLRGKQELKLPVGGIGIVITGPEGSGKTTFSQGLSDKLGIPHISTSAMIGTHSTNPDSPFHEDARRMYDEKRPIPAGTLVGMFSERILQADCKKGFIIDGGFRGLEEIQRFAEMRHTMSEEGSNIPPLVVVRLRLPSREIRKRLISGEQPRARKDDTTELLAERLGRYRIGLQGRVRFMRNNFSGFTVNADKPVAEVFRGIERQLTEAFGAK